MYVVCVCVCVGSLYMEDRGQLCGAILSIHLYLGLRDGSRASYLLSRHLYPEPSYQASSKTCDTSLLHSGLVCVFQFAA